MVNDQLVEIGVLVLLVHYKFIPNALPSRICVGLNDIWERVRRIKID